MKKPVVVSGVVSALALVTLLAQIPPERKGAAVPRMNTDARMMATAPPASKTEGFDAEDALSLWGPFGTTTQIQRKNDAGYYLSAKGFMGRDAVGVVTRDPGLAGEFRHPGAISFDYRLSVQQRQDYRLVILLQRDASSRYWYRVLPHTPSQEWRRVDLSLSPTWTDEQARAEGWVMQTEGVAPSISWQETARSSYRIAIKVEIPGFAAAQGYMTVLDIDNLSVLK